MVVGGEGGGGVKSPTHFFCIPSVIGTGAFVLSALSVFFFI